MIRQFGQNRAYDRFIRCYSDVINKTMKCGGTRGIDNSMRDLLPHLLSDILSSGGTIADARKKKA